MPWCSDSWWKGCGVRKGSSAPAGAGRGGTGASGTPDNFEDVVVRPFLAAFPGAGGWPRRFATILRGEEWAVLLRVEVEVRVVVEVRALNRSGVVERDEK